MVEYFRIFNGTELPGLVRLKPYKAIVVIEAPVAPDWQAIVSAWLVKSGCLYMLAWGDKCSTWDDSVDNANLDAFHFSPIPDEAFVMTTWHENESIEEVFWFAKYCAFHPSVEIKNVMILHIGESSKREFFKAMYEAA